MEKKFYPRIMTDLPVIVENQDHVRLKVVAKNASSDGFSFLCSTRQRNIITPGGCFIRAGRPIELSVWLDLPTDSEQSYPFKARCHIAFSRRLALDLCEIGIRYQKIEGNGYAQLLEFLEWAATSETNIKTASTY